MTSLFLKVDICLWVEIYVLATSRRCETIAITQIRTRYRE